MHLSKDFPFPNRPLLNRITFIRNMLTMLPSILSTNRTPRGSSKALPIIKNCGYQLNITKLKTHGQAALTRKSVNLSSIFQPILSGNHPEHSLTFQQWLFLIHSENEIFTPKNHTEKLYTSSTMRTNLFNMIFFITKPTCSTSLIFLIIIRSQRRNGYT